MVTKIDLAWKSLNYDYVTYDKLGLLIAFKFCEKYIYFIKLRLIIRLWQLSNPP